MKEQSRKTILEILDLARWAPSGDNTQPWRFEIAAEDFILVHGFDTRDHCVYDLDGHASQLSLGAMLETLRLAASHHGFAAMVTRRSGSLETRPILEVGLVKDPHAEASPLVEAIKARRVQRRPLSTRPLTAQEKSALSASLPSSFSLIWIEGLVARWQVARTLFTSARIRLTMPEAFETHRRVIAWNARYSDDRIPDGAVGLDPISTKLMQWAMQDWRRVRFMNRYLAGTIAPRLQLDLLPGIACAAHVLILADFLPVSIDNYIAAGSAVQRFWLTATTLGLQHQPEMTPIIFARYAREGRSFSAARGMSEAAQEVKQRLQAATGGDALARTVWMGRVGAGTPAECRSLRLPLEKLIVSG